MSRHRTIPALLVTAAATTALAGLPATADTQPCPDPGDSFVVGWTIPYPGTNGSGVDELAISPADASFDIAHGPVCTWTTLTIARPDGSGEHTMTMDQYIDGVDIGIWEVGTETVPYATGTGPWRITKVSAQGTTVALDQPVDYRVRRASSATLFVSPGTLPRHPRATGVVGYWTYQGGHAASPGRTVVIRSQNYPGAVLATTTTDARGGYSVDLPIGTSQYVGADVPGTTTLGFVFTPRVLAAVYHPTAITGRVAATTATVIRAGTRMSTYGHLSVVRNDGTTGPFTNQEIVVQLRPRANPAAGYSTIAAARTTSTGYYYTNWNIPYDADVRVAYLSPYRFVRSSYRWLALVDVR
jgi:hypothetical protein